MASLNSWNTRYGGAAGATQGVSAGASRGTGTCVKASFLSCPCPSLVDKHPPGWKQRPTFSSLRPTSRPARGGEGGQPWRRPRCKTHPQTTPPRPGSSAQRTRRQGASLEVWMTSHRKGSLCDCDHLEFHFFCQVRPYKLFPQVPEPSGCCGKDAADSVCFLDQVRPVLNIASLPRVPRVIVSSTTAAPAAASLPRGPNRGSLQLCLLHSSGGTRSPCGPVTATTPLSSIAGFPLVSGRSTSWSPAIHPTPPTRPLALPLPPEPLPSAVRSTRLLDKQCYTRNAVGTIDGFAPLTSALFLFMQNPNPNPDPPSSRKRPNRPTCLVSARPSCPAASTTTTCPKSLRPLPKGILPNSPQSLPLSCACPYAAPYPLGRPRQCTLGSPTRLPPLPPSVPGFSPSLSMSLIDSSTSPG